MLLLLMALVQDAGCFPTTGDRLTSDDIEIREQTLEALIGRGPKAVPAIRKALEGARDLELKGRLEQALKALTEIRWRTDLDAALKAAADEKKPLLIYATRGRLGGWS